MIHNTDSKIGLHKKSKCDDLPLASLQTVIFDFNASKCCGGVVQVLAS